METKKPTHGPNGLLKGAKINPTGKGGFGDHPEHRAIGRWKKEDSISFQYNRLLRMTQAEFDAFKEEPDLTMAQKIAVARFDDAESSLNDTKEITDRTEGKAPQFIGVGGSEDYQKVLVEFVDADDPDTD